MTYSRTIAGYIRHLVILHPSHVTTPCGSNPLAQYIMLHCFLSVWLYIACHKRRMHARVSAIDCVFILVFLTASFPNIYTRLIPRPHPLTRRNGLVNQVEFLGLAHNFATVPPSNVQNILHQTRSKKVRILE